MNLIQTKLDIQNIIAEDENSNIQSTNSTNSTNSINNTTEENATSNKRIEFAAQRKAKRARGNRGNNNRGNTGRNISREERAISKEKRLIERLANMSPEKRQKTLDRKKAKDERKTGCRFFLISSCGVQRQTK